MKEPTNTMQPRALILQCTLQALLASGGTLMLLLCSSALGHAQSLPAVPVMTQPAGATTNCAAATDAFGDGCPASQSKLKLVWGSVSDGAGNLYLADSGNNVIRKIDAKTGIITLFAGGATTVCSAAVDSVGDGCPATQATLNGPHGLGFDHAGNLVFPDTSNQRLRSIDMQTGIITSISGTGVAATAVPSNTNPLVSSVTAMDNSSAFAIDPLGNLYITNGAKQNINLVTAIDGRVLPDQSLVYNLAGSGTLGETGDGGLATNARLDSPRGIVIDPSGNVIFGDYGSFNVREITAPVQNGILTVPPKSTVSKIAGTGVAGITGDGGPATSATLGNTADINFDPSGNLYILTFGTGTTKVRLVNRDTQMISTYAGTGVAGTTGNNGPAIAATFNGAESLSVDRFGKLFIDAMTGNNIRAVSLNTLFPWTSVGASSAAQSIVAQASSALMLQSATITPTTSTEFTLGTLSGCSINGALASGAYCTLPVAFMPSLPGVRAAQLTLVDHNAVKTVIGLSGFGMAPATKFSAATIATIAGNGKAGNTGMTGPAASAQVNAPRGGMVDGAGNLFFADRGNHVVRKIDTNGAITTVAGNGAAGTTGDGGAATAAELNAPADVAMDPAGDLFIADSGNNKIRMVDANTGLISTIAGTGVAGYTGDTGDATAATLNNPQALALQPDGTLYVADTGNNVVRRFFPRTGYMATVAGNGTATYTGDGGYPSLATLNTPMGIAIDASGNLYIADSGNAVVRVVTPYGQISTFAGKQGTTANAGDGAAATQASLVGPSDIGIDAAGDIYIASGGVVRMVNAAGIITTVAGGSSAGAGAYSGEGGVATNAVIPSPASNIMVDTIGNLYIADTAGNRILAVNAANAGALDMGVQSPGTTGSPQTVTLLNTGNTPLVLTSIAASTNYVLQTTDPASCSVATPVAPGQACTLNIAFSPSSTSSGTVTGTVVLTDNALNTAGATQTITLTGAARLVLTTMTIVTLNSTSPVYGTTPTATATITGGVGVTGNVVFSVNGSMVATVAVSGNTASLPLTGLQSGANTVSALYQGDFNNATSSGTLPFTVQRASLTVTATDETRPTGTVNPTLAYTFSGFVNGDTSAAILGTPSLTVNASQSSPAGAYPIVIKQGTLSAMNYMFVFVNGTLTVTAGGPAYGFTLKPVAPTLDVRASEPAVEAIVLSSVGGYTGTVTLTCSGAPSFYDCSIDPSAVVLNGIIDQNTQVSLTNNGRVMLREAPSPVGGHPVAGSLAMLALTLPFGWLWRKKPGRTKIGSLLLLALLSVGTAMVTGGCGQGTTAGAGQYTISVTATNNSIPAIVQMATFVVNVH